MIDQTTIAAAIEKNDYLVILEGWAQWGPYNKHQLMTGSCPARNIELDEFTHLYGMKNFLMQYSSEKEAILFGSRISNEIPDFFAPKKIKRTQEKCPTFFKVFPSLVEAKIESAKKASSKRKKPPASKGKLNIPAPITDAEQNKTNNSLNDCLIEENSILESAIFNPKSSHINDMVSLRKEGATSIKYEQNGSTTKYEIQF
jgi:hypothetical protein